VTDIRLAVLAADVVAELTDRLRADGVRVLRATMVDSAGVLRAKQVPVARAGSFHSPGLGAAPSWAVFCADDAVAFTPGFTAVGDMRIRADLDALVDLGDGTAWAPVELADQDGEPLPFCPRGVLRRQQAAAEREGLTVVGATEIEFTLVDRATGAIPGGPAYGISRLLDHAGFVDDIHRDFERAGVALEQLHAEYGAGQMELSVAPQSPLGAADANTLCRILLGRAARRHGLALSFSPQPASGGIGNGAHIHLSFLRGPTPLLSGGDGPYGLTPDGEGIVASLVAGLPETIGALAPSALSALRLQPGHWSGAFACWGHENREAAVRLCMATAGNPYGAHLEVKCVDPSANSYVAYALLLGLARRGLADGGGAPKPVTVDPASLSDRQREEDGIVAIGGDHRRCLADLAASRLAQDVLGSDLVEALVAVRRHEADLADAGIPALVERLRFAWSA
jgi:glutamine synthetase